MSKFKVSQQNINVAREMANGTLTRGIEHGGHINHKAVLSNTQQKDNISTVYCLNVAYMRLMKYTFKNVIKQMQQFSQIPNLFNDVCKKVNTGFNGTKTGVPPATVTIGS